VSRTDPVGGWNFSVGLVETSSVTSVVIGAVAGPLRAGFSECTGLETSMAVEEYREGGRNDTVLRFPGRVSWSPLRLRRGVVASPELWQWYEAFVLGRGKRRDGVVTLHDSTGRPVRVWRFHRGIPSRWAGPALNATQNAVAVEELEIVHEGIRPESGSVVSQIAGAVAGVAGALGL
jgi:phage tail-like protein